MPNNNSSKLSPFVQAILVLWNTGSARFCEHELAKQVLVFLSSDSAQAFAKTALVFFLGTAVGSAIGARRMIEGRRGRRGGAGVDDDDNDDDTTTTLLMPSDTTCTTASIMSYSSHSVGDESLSNNPKENAIWTKKRPKTRVGFPRHRRTRERKKSSTQESARKDLADLRLPQYLGRPI